MPIIHSKPAIPTKLSIKTGQLTLGKVSKQIPCIPIPSSPDYFLYFKLNDHVDLVNEGARLIAERIKDLNIEHPYFVTPEASTIALAHVLRHAYNINGEVIYKKRQLNDIDPVNVSYKAVTSPDEQQLFLGLDKIQRLNRKNIIIIDSVCTTGGTITGLYNLLLKANIPSQNITEAIMLFMEGKPRNSLIMPDKRELIIHSFSHLPLIRNACD